MPTALIAILLQVTTIHSSTAGLGARSARNNPNKMICVTQGATGSRVHQVRECHTAQQWQDQKMQEQVGLMRKQFVGGQGNPRAGDSPP
jgi:hypothetical protein